MVRYCTYKWLEYILIFHLMLLLWLDTFFVITTLDALNCKLFELQVTNNHAYTVHSSKVI